MTGLLKRFKPYIILFLVVIFGYWQISFLASSLKWDLIDVVFPFRFYFSECIQSGYFPFWNPYLQTGTPFFADLQAPTFYPELLYTSLFSGYSIYTMHFWFVLYVFIAAAGMYRLSFYFNKNQLASIVAGIAYSFSGFIIGHGQHFFLLVGAAWIPHIVINYIQLSENRTFFNTIKTAIVVFLMVSGAYQALSFSLMYLIILIFFYFLIREIRAKNYAVVKELFLWNLLLFLLVVLFSLPLIISTIEILTSVDRLAGGVNLEKALNNGLSLKSVISFVLPFSTLNYDEFFGGADISMRNHYFGLIPLLFFIAGLATKRTKIEYLILAFGVFIFASSFAFLPVREFMFRYVPFMNLFKYAAYISVFGSLAFILLAANFLANVQLHFKIEKKKILFVGILLLCGLLFLISYSIGKITAEEYEMLASHKSISGWLNNMTFYQRVLGQSVFQFIVVTLFLLIIFYHKKLKYPFRLIFVLFVVEMLVASQLNIVFTVTDSNYKPFKMKNDLALSPEGFPTPVNGKVVFNDNMHESFQPFWRNTYVFTKQVSFNAFSSFELNSFNKLDDDYPNLKNAVLNNHLFYFSDTIFPLEHFADSLIDKQKDAAHLYFSDADFKTLSAKNGSIDSTATIKITQFSPNKVIVETDSKTDQFLTMLQTNFKGWKAFIDNTNTPIYTSNFNYRTIFLPKGTHSVRFEYSNNKVLVLYILSNICFLFSVLLLIGIVVRNSNLPGKTFVFIPLVLLMLIAFFVLKRLAVSDKNHTTNEVLAERWANKTSVFQFKKDFETEPDKKTSEDSILYKPGFKINPEMEYFPITEFPVDNKMCGAGTLVVTAKVFSDKYPEALVVSDVTGSNVPDTWHASKIERQMEQPGQWNDLIYCRNFYELNENDTIKVFIWNLNKTGFEIDNITVDFYPLK